MSSELEKFYQDEPYLAAFLAINPTVRQQNPICGWIKSHSFTVCICSHNVVKFKIKAAVWKQVQKYLCNSPFLFHEFFQSYGSSRHRSTTEITFAWEHVGLFKLCLIYHCNMQVQAVPTAASMGFFGNFILLAMTRNLAQQAVPKAIIWIYCPSSSNTSARTLKHICKNNTFN